MANIMKYNIMYIRITVYMSSGNVNPHKYLIKTTERIKKLATASTALSNGYCCCINNNTNAVARTEKSKAELFVLPSLVG